MNPETSAYDWLEPGILSPTFFNPIVNAVAEEDREFLRMQLARHHFIEYVLPGAEMTDRHGVCRSMAALFGVPESALGYGKEVIPDFAGILRTNAAKRIAIVLESADRFIEADVQRLVALLDAVTAASTSLRNAIPRRQLLGFLCGPGPAFSPIDEAAKRRARATQGIKVLPTDVTILSWTAPRDFDLGASHQLLLSNADWYFASRGHRAEGSDSWHCMEQEDRLVFIRADTGAPAIEGVFARVPRGMQLVGIRYEGDEARRRISLVGEDPFTVFRRLGQELHLF
ncbi:MAG TPA: hypothetical protein VNT79_15405 [Phycisphaerae bacterium]|nr:hypothetical protein [Phycisphaerae bacterium]